MASDSRPISHGSNGYAAICWDLAGTLAVYDPISGKPGPLPGWDEYLPELGRDFRLVVTTGEGTGMARALLAGWEMLSCFEDVYGDLLSHGGKPYGEILRQMGCRPERSLVVGDRLCADRPRDTDKLVTILVNQDGEVLNAGMIAHVVRRLAAEAPDFPAAFAAMTERAAPDPEAVGPVREGEVTAAWRLAESPNLRLWKFRQSSLDPERPIIII